MTQSITYDSTNRIEKLLVLVAILDTNTRYASRKPQWEDVVRFTDLN